MMNGAIFRTLGAGRKAFARCLWVAVLLVASGGGTAFARVVVVDDPGGLATCQVWITDEITQADVAKMNELPCEPQTIALSSPGGDVDAAMEIGRWLRAQKRGAVVLKDCMSSCALIFIGAVHRSNLGRIGLHRPYLAGSPRSPAEVQATVSEMYRRILEYVDEMGITPDFAHVMLNTPPDEMRVFQYDIVQFVPEADPLWDEMRIADRATDFGIATEEYRRREKAAQACLAIPLKAHVHPDDRQREVKECWDATVWGLSQSEYRARNAAVVPRCLLPDHDARAALLADLTDHPAWARFLNCQRDVMAGR